MDMDMVQDWAAYFLGPNAAISSYGYARQFFDFANTARAYITPLIEQIARKPDLATIALLLVILFISLKLLNMLYQTVLFWFRMARRVAFWGGLVSVGIWMYSRGPEGVAADVQYWYDTWMGEYQQWKEQERVAKLLNQQGGHGRRAWH